ncbi:CerR family C-terminal domain-containing protein [Sphingomonas cannabina]|uniref:CerR family C-terminal domain-containing protein n=1 Tax=Sphingomonas cannabina TaxID=2899123 RepID=UPI001F2EAFCA|nr:CerR family C-terminal domain-containing protein [Sphingomonas cannabina]UIJ44527.1 CerR family C-terminal domain-containing protein [Sphingomonas cannabina]
MLSSVLLDTAIEHFGRNGYEGASTRAIANASRTAMSSITYHFGGKKGLYLAAADHIAAGIAERQAEVLQRVREAGAATREQAIEEVLMLLESLARMMLAKDTEHWARFIIREQQFPTEAFHRIFGGAMQPIAETLIGLVGQVRTDLDPRELRATAVLMVGQVLMLRAGHAAVCRVFEVLEIDRDLADLLIRRLRANARCILSEKPE